MKDLPRIVEPEWLDLLPAEDPRAIRSRADLRRINRLMSHAGILTRILRRWPAAPRTLADLGAGDGSLMATLARRMSRQWPQVTVELVDRQPVVSAAVLRAIEAQGWHVRVVAADVMDWLASRDEPPVDLLVANLFLHHFPTDKLAQLLQQAAGRSKGLVACEPRRSRVALGLSHLLGVIGCNEVTRHDAAVSVRAGFRGNDLSRLWPQRRDWRCREYSVGPLTHCFITAPRTAYAAPGR